MKFARNAAFLYPRSWGELKGMHPFFVRICTYSHLIYKFLLNIFAHFSILLEHWHGEFLDLLAGDIFSATPYVRRLCSRIVWVSVYFYKVC
jgi:hypothetical protein